jgi:hypothetical protein
MVHVYAAREEGRQRLVVFDTVVKRVDHSVEGIASAARPPPTPGLPSRPLTSRSTVDAPQFLRASTRAVSYALRAP